MLTESAATEVGSGRRTIASVRILRLALGTSLALWFSQAVDWQLSFIAPIMTSVILALPLPALKVKSGIGLVVVLALSLNAGMLLLPTLLNQTAVGILLLGLALYWTFYFTAKGGAAALGTFATIGIAASTTFGSVSLDAMLELATSMTFVTAVGVMFVWLAHAAIPDSMAVNVASPPGGEKTDAPKPDLGEARWRALRSLIIVMPVAIWILFSSSTATVPVMLKVASMGQQTTRDQTRQASRSLILSTLIGGVAAMIGWQILSITPTLSIYVLITGLAALLMGPRIFQGQAAHPDAATWSYGFLTMLVILAPAVIDSIGGNPAGPAFLDRMLLIIGATVYAVVAVNVVDAFRPARKNNAGDI